jgi:EAL domain-containing protein (putative c-di-GMP-specific phosphodiesterase class I)
MSITGEVAVRHLPAMPVLATTTIASLLADLGELEAHFQPIVDLTTGQPVAYEALARFGSGTAPAVAFARASEHGVRHELEALAIRAALGHRHGSGGARRALNVSPSALTSPAVQDALPRDLSGVIVEITENELVTSESAIRDVLDGLRRRGAQIAVDDAGAGYASLRQVLALSPDIIKLDRSLVGDVHADAAKAALVRAFVTMGRQLDALVCAEGIEAPQDLLALADLDVALGQGYLLGRPAPGLRAVDPLAASACRLSQRAALLPADPAAATTIEVVAQQLAACATYDELDGCVAAIQRLLGVEEISISRLVTGDDGAPGLLACAGPRWPDEPVYPLVDFPATAEALATGEAIQVLVRDGLADPAERELVAAHGYGAMMLVPLRCRGEAVGTMEIYRRDPRAWSRRQIVCARGVGHQVSMVLAHLG